MIFQPLTASPESLVTIVDWIDTQWSVYSGRSRQQTLDRFAQELVESDGALPETYVAIDGSVACGVISLRDHDSTDYDPGTSPWICNVYVPAGYRGRGLAADLVRFTLDKAADLGFIQVYIASEQAPENLYTRLGFEVYNHYRDARNDQYLMRRTVR